LGNTEVVTAEAPDAGPRRLAIARRDVNGPVMKGQTGTLRTEKVDTRAHCAPIVLILDRKFHLGSGDESDGDQSTRADQGASPDDVSGDSFAGNEILAIAFTIEFYRQPRAA